MFYFSLSYLAKNMVDLKLFFKTTVFLSKICEMTHYNRMCMGLIFMVGELTFLNKEAKNI